MRYLPIIGYISISPLNTFFAGPVIIIPSSVISTVKIPPGTMTFTTLSTKFNLLQSTTEEQHPVPQARVGPAPLSQVFTFISLLFTTLQKLTLVPWGNNSCFSIAAPSSTQNSPSLVRSTV